MNRFALVSLALLVALLPAVANAQAIIKVNDNVNVKIGLILQTQADYQEVGTGDTSLGYQQNFLLRRARLILGGQVAKNVFFFVDTENANLGKTTVGGTGTGLKAPGTGFNLLDAVGEWRIAKEFNVQFGEILVPTNRWIVTSSGATFNLDQSAYNNLYTAALQNNAGRDTGVMFRGYFLNDHLEYRSAILSGFRAPGVRNSPRFTEFLQYNFFDTEVYNMPSFSGVNYGKKKILALGGAYDAQADYVGASAHLFADFPVDFGSVEGTAVYQYFNTGRFAAAAALPEQNTFSAEAGVFVKKAHFAPVLRYEQKEFQHTVDKPKNEKRYVGGLDFFPIPGAENNFNIKAWYSRVVPNVGFASNEFTIQIQIFYF